MKKLHYAWVVCIAGALAMICAMGLCCSLLSAYLPYIVASGISGSAASAIVSINGTATLLTLFFVSWYYDRLSLRAGITLALFMASAAMLLFSLGGSAAVYCSASAVAGAALGLGGSIPLSLLIGAWFRARRGTALGFASAGSGLSVICFPVLIDRLVSRVGLRGMFLCAALFTALVAVAVWLLIRSSPSEMGLSPYGEAEDSLRAVSVGSSSLTSVGWALLVVLMVVQGGYSPSVSHLSVTMNSEGYAPERAAAFLSFYGIFVTASKFLFGALADRIGAKRTTLISYVMAALGCLMPLFMDGSLLWPCAGAALMLGMGIPPNTVGIALVAADISSPRTYARAMKWMEITSYLGSIIVGLIPGMLYDRFGSYRGGYALMALLAAVSIPLLWLLYRARQSEETPVDQ